MQLSFKKFVLLSLLLLAAPLAEAKTRVVATTGSLGSLTRAIGGDRVDVRVLAPPTSDPHFVDGRPSFVVALSRAELLVHVGLGLEAGWLPGLLANSRNRAILSGSVGNLDASTVAGPLMDVDQSTDRARGDVHAGGNPHYLFDPRMGVNVALGIARRLVEIDPDNADHYRTRAAAFKSEMQGRIAAWDRKITPYRGSAYVAYHESTNYLARWLKLRVAGHIETLPGVPPSPSHLARLIVEMRRAKVAVIVSEAWYDAETARVVASKTGAHLVRLPGDVGASGIDSYAALIDRAVTGLVAGFAQK